MTPACIVGMTQQQSLCSQERLVSLAGLCACSRPGRARRKSQRRNHSPEAADSDRSPPETAAALLDHARILLHRFVRLCHQSSTSKPALLAQQAFGKCHRAAYVDRVLDGLNRIRAASGEMLGHPTAVSSKSSARLTRLTKPSSSASEEVSVFPSRHNSSALAVPRVREKNCVPPPPGMRPIKLSTWPMTGLSVSIRIR